MDEKIKNKLKKTKSYSLLIISPAEKLQDNINDFVMNIANQDIPCIYVTLNKPYKSVKSMLKRMNVKTDKIFFIDAITSSITKEMHEDKYVYYIQDPTDLTGLSIAIGQFIKAIKGEKYLVIDSLRTLLLYNLPGNIAKFVRSLTEKTSRYNVKMVIFIIEGEDKKLIEKILEFFDEVVKTNGKEE